MQMRLVAFFILGFFISKSGLLPAQSRPAAGKYWVEFKDKNHSPFSLYRPWEFLSARAIERRARAGISIEENDLPVNPAYVQALRNQGAVIYLTSRWLNAAAVLADEQQVKAIQQLPFVQTVQYVGRHIPAKNPPNRPAKGRKPMPNYPRAGDGSEALGYAAMQNSLLGTPLLYYTGFRGQGIWVAVMDGGFTNADTMPIFDSLALNGRLLPGRDWVERDNGVFEGASHGTAVLSVMGGNLPGYFVGNAPDATYFLIKTEDTAGEYPIEECNWVAGAEWADSVGVQIINASLGYTAYNDTSLSHQYSVLNGRTAIASRGAAIAATKGMIVCNSAGNSGDEPWRFIGVPADAPGLIAVGAVDYDGKRASFSSFGPSTDGRIKPELCAPGEQVVTAGASGIQLGLSNGTSLASPMLAGGLAALWSAFPEKNAAEILDAVFEDASQGERPDNELGYGIPDLGKTFLKLSGFFYENSANNTHQSAFFAERPEGFALFCYRAPFTQIERMELLNLDGRPLFAPAFQWEKGEIAIIQVRLGGQTLQPGAYRLRINGITEYLVMKF